MKHWALIDDKTQLVTNVIVWDGEQQWSPPEGYSIVECTDNYDAEIGGSYVNNVFIRPNKTIIEDVTQVAPAVI